MDQKLTDPDSRTGEITWSAVVFRNISRSSSFLSFYLYILQFGICGIAGCIKLAMSDIQISTKKVGLDETSRRNSLL